MEKKQKLLQKSKIYLIYTAIFCLISFVVYFIFIKSGRTFIWESDGYRQHFSIFYNFNETIRNLGQNGISTFSWNLGLGIDVIGQYSYYILGDPFAYISLLFPMSKLELAYGLLIILRVYFAGIAFIAFCRYNKKSTFNSMLGAVIYTFSGFVLYASVRHPFFMNALIMFPLMLLAIDKLYKENKIKLFIIVVAIAAIMNYYFLYIMSILAFIYAVIKFFCEYKDNGYKFLFKKFGKAMLAYLVGIMIAGVLLLPTISAYMNSNRIGNAETTTYGFKYYKTIFVGLTSNSSLYWSRICVPSIVLLMIPIMLKNLKNNKENKTIWICFLIETIMLLFNFFGSFMNGFSFQSNRWVFGYTFLMAYIVTINFRRNLKYNKNDILNMAAMLVIYICGLIICRERISILTSLICCGFSVVILALIILNRKLKDKTKILRYIILALVIGNVMYYGLDLYTKLGKNYSEEFIKQGQVIKKYNNLDGKIKNYNKAINKIKEKDDGFYRISNNAYTNTNVALIQNYKALSAYLSIGNKYVGQLCKQLNNRAYNSDTNPLRELDSRTKITTLMGNKYFIIAKGNENYVPYGYEKIATIKKNTKVYENTKALPIGVFYDNYLYKEEYDKLTPLEKEQAILDTAVIEDKNIKEQFPNIENKENLVQEIKDKTTKSVNYEMIDKNKLIKTAEQQKQEDSKNKNKKNKKTEKYNNKITVKEEKQAIELSIEKVKDCELYVEIKNFKAKSKNKYEVEFKYGNVTKSKVVRDAVDDPYYIKTDNVLINLGYKKTHSGKIEVVFKTSGEYTYDEIKVLAVPMNVYNESVEKIKQTPFNLTNYTDTSLEGNIENEKDGILQISTPYTKGWKAFVDGKEEEIINVNTAFIGIPLKSGKHEIVLKYETPYLKEGTILTIVGLTLGIILIVYENKKNKENKMEIK